MNREIDISKPSVEMNKAQLSGNQKSPVTCAREKN